MESPDFIFTSRSDVYRVLIAFIQILDNFAVIALADYKELIGLNPSDSDTKWGWTHLNKVEIRQVSKGYVIDLPPLEEI